MRSDLNSRFQVLHEFVAAAREEMTPEGWNYLIGGSETETAVARNRASIDAIALRHRVLVDVSGIGATADFWAIRAGFPFAWHR